MKSWGVFALCRSSAQWRVVSIGSDAGVGVFAPHRDLAADYGEEALREGKYPRRRRGSALVRVVGESESSSSTDAHALTSEGNGVVGPSEVRPRLAQAAAANLSELERVLVETATGANRQIWVTVTCKHCERQGP